MFQIVSGRTVVDLYVKKYAAFTKVGSFTDKNALEIYKVTLS